MSRAQEMESEKPDCGGKSDEMTEQIQNPEAAVPEEISLEEMFRELDGIMERMESADVSLEDAFSLYEKGMKMIRRCNEKLDLVEKKMVMIARNGEEVPFEEEE